MKDKIIAYLMKFMRVEVGAVGIIVKDDKVLLTKRNKAIAEGGKWCLPGGHTNKWEKSEETARREIKEELGFEFVKSRLLFVHEEFVLRLGLHAVVFVYLVDVKGKEKKNWEVSESKWFSKNEIEKLNMAFTHKEMLMRYWK